MLRVSCCDNSVNIFQQQGWCPQLQSVKMGNCNCSCKRCCPLCSKEQEDVIRKRVYKSICEYSCNTLSDLKLKKGDILEVIEEKEHWVYAKRVTRNSGENGFIEEQVYVPKDFLKPVDSLEAQP